MKNCLLTFTIITIFAGSCAAQTYIEPIAGFQTDISNKAKFQQINLGVQFSFKTNQCYELIVRVQRSSGLAYHSNDSSFTANNALPLYTNAAKTIHPSAWYLSLDQRFILNSGNKKYGFAVLLLAGITAQKITVHYQYDKVNYTILNPDQTQKITTLFVGTGIEYMRLIDDNRFFIQLTINAPLASLTTTYPSSFSYLAPLAVNVGYSYLIKKKRHEK